MHNIKRFSSCSSLAAILQMHFAHRNVLFTSIKEHHSAPVRLIHKENVCLLISLWISSNVLDEALCVSVIGRSAHAAEFGHIRVQWEMWLQTEAGVHETDGQTV